MGRFGERIRAGRRLAGVPRELRELPQWVLWRVEQRNGKETKPPYQVAHPARKASSTDPATWATFDDAYTAFMRGAGDGVGFVFTPGDPYAGVDLDKCLRDGELDAAARPVVERLHSYTECSPSGDGLHVIGKGEVGGGRRTGKTPWEGELELYDRDRFFTMTGRRYDDAPTKVLELVELDALRAELMPDTTPTAPTVADTPAVRGMVLERLDDRELLERAFAAGNGAKFRALWQGDTSGYKSPSEAELALLSMLAFWTGPDEARIDWLFRQSALVRPKWEEREDYRAATIGRALAGKTEFFGTARTLPVVTTSESALEVASAVIQMEDVPLVEAVELRGGRVVLERADGLRMGAPSLATLAQFQKLAGLLGSEFGHELILGKEKKTPTALRFVAALRRHFGPAHADALEEQFEGWLVELVRYAAEVTFTAGNAEGRMRAWRTLDNADPEKEHGARSFASAVVLAHDLTTGDRYLRSGWAQEYVRRCGYRGSTEQAAGILEHVGLEQPGKDGRVRARWRAGGDTLTLRFWVIPGRRFEHWKSE